jgi:hypothetical protein
VTINNVNILNVKKMIYSGSMHLKNISIIDMAQFIQIMCGRNSRAKQRCAKLQLAHGSSDMNRDLDTLILTLLGDSSCRVHATRTVA